MGIGENGHLASSIRPCAISKIRATYAPSSSTTSRRMQQVHDGALRAFEDVPSRALSLTVPFFLRVPRALIFVNGEHKSAAVHAALDGPVAESCPASALRRHPNAILFLDPAAARYTS